VCCGVGSAYVLNTCFGIGLPLKVQKVHNNGQLADADVTSNISAEPMPAAGWHGSLTQPGTSRDHTPQALPVISRLHKPLSADSLASSLSPSAGAQFSCSVRSRVSRTMDAMAPAQSRSFPYARPVSAVSAVRWSESRCWDCAAGRQQGCSQWVKTL
jgi:hypothetical protein